MQATTTFPHIAGERPTDMGKTPQVKTQGRFERWAQTLSIIATVCAIGVPLLGYMRDGERRQTAMETTLTLMKDGQREQTQAQRESTAASVMAVRSSQTVLEILLKMRLPKEDRKRVEEELAEIKAKKISSNYADFGDRFEKN